MKDSSYAFATGYVWKSPKEEAGNELRVRTSFNQRSFFLLLIDISFDGCVQFVLSLSLPFIFPTKRGFFFCRGFQATTIATLQKEKERDRSLLVFSLSYQLRTSGNTVWSAIGQKSNSKLPVMTELSFSH